MSFRECKNFVTEMIFDLLTSSNNNWRQYNMKENMKENNYMKQFKDLDDFIDHTADSIYEFIFLNNCKYKINNYKNEFRSLIYKVLMMIVIINI